MLGETLAQRFLLEHELGRGGMGVVYRAFDKWNGTPCAVKVLAPSAEARRFFREARVLSGLTHPAIVRYVAHGASPTGELFLKDVRCGIDRLLGGEQALAKGRAAAREGAKDTFQMERTGVAAMALGIVERCLELSVKYARERVQWDKPIGEYQLIQDKLARMEVARMNLQNLVFRVIELASQGKSMTLAEASAMKLYSARAAVASSN